MCWNDTRVGAPRPACRGEAPQKVLAARAACRLGREHECVRAGEAGQHRGEDSGVPGRRQQHRAQLASPRAPPALPLRVLLPRGLRAGPSDGGARSQRRREGPRGDLARPGRRGARRRRGVHRRVGQHGAEGGGRQAQARLRRLHGVSPRAA